MRRFSRYLGLAAAILFFFWIVGLAVVYFVVDVDTIKKAAVKAVNENTNGELAVGTVNLKLFPMVHFEVNDLVFRSSENFGRKELFSSKKTKLSFGILSLILGKPNITLSLYDPTLNIVSNGKMNNVKDIIKKTPQADKSSSSTDVKFDAAKNKPKDSKDALSYLFMSKFTFKMKNASLSYTTPKGSNNVKGLSLNFSIDPLVKAVDLEIVAPMDGDLKIFAKIKPVQGDKLSVNAEIDATGLNIKNGSFSKKKGVPLKAILNGWTDLKSVEVDAIDIVLVEQWLNGKGKITGIDGDDPSVTLEISSAPFGTKNFAKLIPALDGPKILGDMTTKIKINGSISKLNLSGDIDATATAISTGSFNKVAGSPLKLSASLVGSDLKMKIVMQDDVVGINGSISQTPVHGKKTVAIAIASDSLNLNTYLPNSKKSSVSVSSGSSGGSSGTGSGNSKGGLLSPSAKNEELIKKEDVQSIKDLLSNYDIKLTAKISKVVFKKYDIRNLVVDTDLNSDKIVVNKKNFEIFGGQIQSAMTVGLDVKRPTYSGKISVKNLKFKDAANIIMPELTGVIDGVISSNIDVSASGYTNGDIQKTLKANGDLSFNNFLYSSAELNNTINGELKSKLGNFAPMENKKIFGSDPGWETVQGSYSVKDQKIYIDKLFAKNKEYEATGKGNMDFNNYIDMFFDVTVPYRNIPFEPMKVAGKDSSMMPMHLTGPVMKPKFDTGYLAKYVADKIFENEKKKLKEKVDKETQKLKEQVKTKGADKLKDLIKGLHF